MSLVRIEYSSESSYRYFLNRFTFLNFVDIIEYGIDKIKKIPFYKRNIIEIDKHFKIVDFKRKLSLLDFYFFFNEEKKLKKIKFSSIPDSYKVVIYLIVFINNHEISERRLFFSSKGMAINALKVSYDEIEFFLKEECSICVELSYPLHEDDTSYLSEFLRDRCINFKDEEMDNINKFFEENFTD